MRFFILLILTLNLYAIDSFEYFEDKTNSLQIEDILKVEDKFTLHNSDKINFGLTKSTFWIKLNLKNRDNFAKNRILELFPTILENIDLYEIGKEIKVHKSGSSINISNRDIKSYHILFNLNLKANEDKKLFLRVQSATVKIMLFKIHKNIEEYMYDSLINNSFNTFLFGILILATFYNLFIYLYIKDKIFIIYVIFVSSQTLFLLSYSGFILNFIDSRYFIEIFTISQFFMMGFLLLLIKEFFQVGKNFKIFNTIFNTLIAIIFCVSLISFFDIHLANKIKNYILIPLLNLFVLTFFIKLFFTKRNIMNLLFMSGWLVYILSAFYFALLINGVVKANFFSVNSLKFGILFEAVLFSILLSYKFYLLKDEKIKALKESAKKEKMLIQQSKMAQMGEMIGNIGHQWKQPLNTLGLIIQKLESDFIFNHKIDENYITKIVDDSLNQITFMSKTVDDFKNFFSPNKKKENFSIKKAIEETLFIISAQIKNNNIELIGDYEDFNIFCSKNEFKQVILNIISNAKDELISNKIDTPQIKIRVYRDNQNGFITIEDNAGGIKEENIDKIFEPYFSTKETNGTGIGLYMSKVIIDEHLNGKLSATNENFGAKFEIVFSIK